MNDAETTRTPFDPAILFKALFLAVIAIFVLVPLLATLLGGFKSLGELRVNPFGLPRHWEWQNYADILFSARYWQLLRNSLIISTLAVTLTLITASMAAFTFAHIKFYGSSALLSYLTLGLLFPAATAVLPLSRPILATVGTITFVNSWNAYLLPLVMLNTDALYPWPLGIMVYQGEYSSEWNLILAFITLTILPTIILFLLAQKHIVAGLTAGAVKG